jgi:hypothetical protein
MVKRCMVLLYLWNGNRIYIQDMFVKFLKKSLKSLVV